MCPVEKVGAMQIAFVPMDSEDYNAEIRQVLEHIRNSGLFHEVGEMSTYVRGGRKKLFQLLEEIYDDMDKASGFVMDVRLSNVCGCD